MTIRENIMAILNYEKYDQMPVTYFGYWEETIQKWGSEGYITKEEAEGYVRYDNESEIHRSIMNRLGFDFNWDGAFKSAVNLGFSPSFERKVLEEKPDGSRIVRNKEGLIVLEKPGIECIPAEIGTSFTDRASWEELYLPKLQWDPSRIREKNLEILRTVENREIPVGMEVGSMIGVLRNWLGVTELSYLYVDDEELYIEMLNTIADLAYKGVKTALEMGARPDLALFWEDITFNHGPLVSPHVFEEHIAPNYKRITDLLKQYGVKHVFVDSDGCIDLLIPMWLKNGVNTMFPIEVGTWNASIVPWREKYGKQLLGVGGMNKSVFMRDYKAIDDEIERLKPMIELGGFIPCVDHLIGPDAKFENIQYYCDKMHQLKL